MSFLKTVRRILLLLIVWGILGSGFLWTFSGTKRLAHASISFRYTGGVVQYTPTPQPISSNTPTITPTQTVQAIRTAVPKPTKVVVSQEYMDILDSLERRANLVILDKSLGMDNSWRKKIYTDIDLLLTLTGDQDLQETTQILRGKFLMGLELMDNTPIEEALELIGKIRKEITL